LLGAARWDCACELEQAVREGGFAMINMGNDGEVAETLDGDLGDAPFEVD